jgi:hypothetical protein
MISQSSITSFLVELELHANKKLQHRSDLHRLIELSWSSGRQQVFEDVVFFAKFMTKSMEVMKRIGGDADGYDKLSNEFQSASEKVLTLLRTLVKDSDEEVKQHFVQSYLSPTPENLPRFLRLLEELAWIKNWQVDGKPLPWEGS